MMNFRTLALGCLVALIAPACSGQDPIAEEVGTAESAATATRIYASEGDLDLSFETLGTFEVRDGVRSLIIRATANRYLESVLSFVPDDAFCQANIISERRFEVVIHEGHELNTLLSGLPLFVAVNTFTGSPNQYTARVEIGARFYDFLGSSSIWIDEAVEPVYVVNGNSHLLYRGKTDVLASSLSVTAPDGAPTVSRVDADSFRLDWTYTNLYQAIDPHTQYLTFAATRPDNTIAKKTTRLVGRVTGLALTSGDAYEVWPTPDCKPEVYSCYHAQPAGTTDFAACGTYREVQRCTFASACDVMPPAPLTLTSIDASSLDDARDAWNDGSNGGDWHGIDSLDAYETPECPAAPVTIQAVAEKVIAQLGQYQQDPMELQYGTFTDRSGLAQSVFFQDGYYGDGSALLAAIDAFTGGGNIQAWLYENELSCHNCHEFGQTAVLYYPASGKVVVLRGYYGYDS